MKRKTMTAANCITCLLLVVCVDLFNYLRIGLGDTVSLRGISLDTTYVDNDIPMEWSTDSVSGIGAWYRIGMGEISGPEPSIVVASAPEAIRTYYKQVREECKTKPEYALQAVGRGWPRPYLYLGSFRCILSNAGMAAQQHEWPLRGEMLFGTTQVSVAACAMSILTRAGFLCLACAPIALVISIFQGRIVPVRKPHIR